MTWFKNHLNWTLGIAWIIANIFGYVGTMTAPADGSLTIQWLLLFIIAAIIIIGTEVWFLRQKKRSLFNLFYNVLTWIGFIIIISLENKANKIAAQEAVSEPSN